MHGAVECKEKCGRSVSVTLMRVAGKHTEERKTVHLTDENNEFHFSNVFPGKYKLEVSECYLTCTNGVLDCFCYEKE